MHTSCVCSSTLQTFPQVTPHGHLTRRASPIIAPVFLVSRQWLIELVCLAQNS